jgi:hypothetical protein
MLRSVLSWRPLHKRTEQTRSVRFTVHNNTLMSKRNIDTPFLRSKLNGGGSNRQSLYSGLPAQEDESGFNANLWRVPWQFYQYSTINVIVRSNPMCLLSRKVKKCEWSKMKMGLVHFGQDISRCVARIVILVVCRKVNEKENWREMV